MKAIYFVFLTPPITLFVYTAEICGRYWGDQRGNWSKDYVAVSSGNGCCKNAAHAITTKNATAI